MNIIRGLRAIIDAISGIEFGSWELHSHRFIASSDFASARKEEERGKKKRHKRHKMNSQRINERRYSPSAGKTLGEMKNLNA